MKLSNLLVKSATLLTWCAMFTHASPTIKDLEYEYIIVGSGAGGGPLACRLPMAGHKTLLIEAGNDQKGNLNITVPGYQAAVTNDPKLRWDIFVNHYKDQSRAERDPKFTWEVSPFNYHVGPNPPAGAKPLGILYPRAGTIGGCVTHNALILITSHASDWDGIANLTGDSSWSAKNMDQYLDKMYEWLPVQPTDPTILLQDFKLAQHLAGGAAVMGFGPDPLAAIPALAKTLLIDPNNRSPGRDSQKGFFQIPLIQRDGRRTAVRDFIESTIAKGYPLTNRQNSHVTKIKFDTTGSVPRATGVDFLDGEYLYSASPLSGGKGTPESVTATKEVIDSAGSFNTPQLLKLSGIGPASDEAIGQYVKDVSWGHHASSTAAIGADSDQNAVLDSNFKVRGVQGLRVVDASVFPTIPGVFIQAPIFMISEKAADVILKGL